MKSTDEKLQECCPPFDPSLWEDEIFVWENKRFIKDKVCTFFFMPINFGCIIKRLDAKVQKAGATIPHWMCLSEHTSLWNMNIFLAVDREVPEAENVTLSGSFFSRVYEGHFKDTGKWHKDFVAIAAAQGLNVKKSFMWYTTCPKCAKKYGKNYVVIMGQVG